MRGGARQGAGRKPGKQKDFSEMRPTKTLRAFDDEWLLIKKFADFVKHNDKSKAEKLLEQLDA